jgi:sortase A
VRLAIPSLSLDVPVVEMSWRIVETKSGRVSEWLVPDNAAGHHINSANLGEMGNVVISGHNNIRGKVFKAISVGFDPQQPDKFVGAKIRITGADGRSFDYVINTVYFFKEKGATLAERQENGRVMGDTAEPTLTIITCWPYTSNTHRIIIQAGLDSSVALDGGLKP